MSALELIAFFRGRRDEAPNQELAAALALTRDRTGIAEIAGNLAHQNKNVQSDCLKVLYEVGYLKPELIASHVEAFLDLLGSRNNRMVWGAMIALGTIATLEPKAIWGRIDEVMRATEKGSLITLVWGIRTLSRVASTRKAYAHTIVPRLASYLETCNPRDVPTHLESMLPALTPGNKGELTRVAEARRAEMTSSHLARLGRVLRLIEAGHGKARWLPEHGRRGARGADPIRGAGTCPPAG